MLLDPQAAHALPADLRRDLRLAAATVLRIKEVDIDDEAREPVAHTLHQLQDRATHGEKFTATEALRAAVEMLANPDRAAPSPTPAAPPAPAEPEPDQSHATPATITAADNAPDFPDLPGALTTRLPSPARLLRAHAGADAAPPTPHPHGHRPHHTTTTQPLKPTRAPPPMMAA